MTFWAKSGGIFEYNTNRSWVFKLSKDLFRIFFFEVEFKQSRHPTTALASMKANNMWAGHPDEVFEAVHCDDAT